MTIKIDFDKFKAANLMTNADKCSAMIVNDFKMIEITFSFEIIDIEFMNERNGYEHI